MLNALQRAHAEHFWWVAHEEPDRVVAARCYIRDWLSVAGAQRPEVNGSGTRGKMLLTTGNAATDDTC